MHNITFILGNGFDLGLGLKTGYMDFYPYFLQKHENNIIAKFLKKDWHTNNIETWADLEIRLGELTNEISVIDYNNFINDKIAMDVCLIEYLNQEYKNTDFQNIKFDIIRNNFLAKIRKGNNPIETKSIEEFFISNLSHDYNYYLINYNYTFCADFMFKAESEIAYHKHNNLILKEIFRRTLHIHGTINNAEAIIGVNDESQILNEELKQKTSICEDLIKTEMNNIIGRDNTNSAQSIINQSFVICLYGLSLGKTDQLWWDMIGTWLTESQNRLLVIFEHREILPEYYDKHFKIANQERERIKTKVMENLNLENLSDNVRNRIVIHINDYIFENVFPDVKTLVMSIMCTLVKTTVRKFLVMNSFLELSCI